MMSEVPLCRVIRMRPPLYHHSKRALDRAYCRFVGTYSRNLQ